jgi:hypothetical protein
MKKAALTLVAFLSLAAVIGFVVTHQGAAELSAAEYGRCADATTVPAAGPAPRRAREAALQSATDVVSDPRSPARSAT